MSSIKITQLLMAMAMVIILALSGCGDKNEKAVFDSVSNSGHPSGWTKTHKAYALADIDACAKCHGTTLTGGVAQLGCFSTPMAIRNGFVCHATNPIVNRNCISCHGTPPNGTAAPNRSGAHDKHLALSGITCDTCHNGAGAGTAKHAMVSVSGGIASATISPLAVSSQAKSFSKFGYNASGSNCSGIICHGGQNTPDWNRGTITVATDCLKCHEQGTASQTPQYNSFYSGQWSFYNGASVVKLHQLHNASSLPGTTSPVRCTNCHNATVLSTQHFTSLTTPGFGVTPASTIGGSGTMISNYVPYSSSLPSGSCISACHSVFNDNPRYWMSP